MTDDSPAYEVRRRDGVVRIRRPGVEWLSSGPLGGRMQADCAYTVSVPEEWNRTDLEAYIDERLERADFGVGDERGPALLTGVDVADARGARCGSVTAYATAGVSNPAGLPMEPTGEALTDSVDGVVESAADSDGGVTAAAAESDDSTDSSAETGSSGRPEPGTVNVVVGTTRSLAPGALANLIAVAAEAKAATLLAATGVPGTTSDAVVAGHDPAGRPATFSGSATPVGAATRACVRDAVQASLEAHYETSAATLPASVEEAEYGVSTDVQADVFLPDEH